MDFHNTRKGAFPFFQKGGYMAEIRFRPVFRYRVLSERESVIYTRVCGRERARMFYYTFRCVYICA